MEHSKLKHLFVMAIATPATILASCNEDDNPVSYEPIPWGGERKKMVFAIDGANVDSAFCANTSVYCE